MRTPENIQYIADIIKATNANNKDFAKTLLTDEKYAFWRTPENIQYFSDIIKNVTNEEKEDFAKILITDEKYRDFREKNSEYIANIIRVINKGNKDFAEKVILNKSILGYYMADLIKNADLFRDSNLDDVLREVEIYKNKMLQNPELYIMEKITMKMKK